MRTLQVDAGVLRSNAEPQTIVCKDNVQSDVAGSQVVIPATGGSSSGGVTTNPLEIVVAVGGKYMILFTGNLGFSYVVTPIVRPVAILQVRVYRSFSPPTLVEPWPPFETEWTETIPEDSGPPSLNLPCFLHHTPVDVNGDIAPLQQGDVVQVHWVKPSRPRQGGGDESNDYVLACRHRELSIIPI